jgi:hypothetical protein
VLYYLTLLIIILVIGFAGIILLKKITSFHKQRKKLQKKESGFINKLVAESVPKPVHAVQADHPIENHSFIFGKENNMENTDHELGRNEVRAFLFGIIDSMSENEMRQLLKDLDARQTKQRRHYERNFSMNMVDMLTLNLKWAE